MAAHTVTIKRRAFKKLYFDHPEKPGEEASCHEIHCDNMEINNVGRRIKVGRQPKQTQFYAMGAAK